MTSQLPTDHFIKFSRFTPTTHRDVYPSISPSNPALSQAGKIAIITGASRGIGKATALTFARASSSGLALVARNLQKLEATKAEIEMISPTTKVVCISASITNSADLEKLVATVNAEFGGADVLVNAAGVLNGRGNIGEGSIDGWWNTMETNIKGTYLMTRTFLSRLLPSGKRGYITHLSSTIHTLAMPEYSGYAISKLAITKLGEHVAAEYPNVISTVLHPGMVSTDMTVPKFVYFSQDTPELAGGVTLYLCSERAEYLNGRYFDSNWDIDEAEARREEIVARDLLKLTLRGEFGDKVVA